jgi:4-hydroxyphenylacetate 3-monooxygenase
LREAHGAMKHWQELGFGWLGRSPDYKASVTAMLGANPGYFAEYAENARSWYKRTQEQVLHIGHAIVHPPVDRDRPVEEAKDVYVHVDRETDNGLVVSGAKVVATGAPVTQHVYVSHVGAPIRDRSMALVFFAPVDAPGVKLIARGSYEDAAARVSSPFDNPLSSRFDENDAILVFDQALIPWESVIVYDVDRANRFDDDTQWGNLAIFQSATRMSVKLDFIAGLLTRALDITGAGQFRGVQAGIGEVLNARHLVAGLVDAMIEGASPGFGGAVVPNFDYGITYAANAPGLYRRVKEIVETVVASGLIYLNSHATDYSSEIRPYLDKYLRGTGGRLAEERSRVMKALWDAIGSEFGGRHELYELNYFARPEVNHLRAYQQAQESGHFDKIRTLTGRFFDDYDLSGWQAPDLINPSDVSVRGK